MTLVVTSSYEDVIALPAWLMTSLKLQEGDKIKTVVEGHVLRLAPLDEFLALRGVLRDDEAFDAAMEFLEQGWKSWTIPNSPRYQHADRLSQGAGTWCVGG